MPASGDKTLILCFVGHQRGWECRVGRGVAFFLQEPQRKFALSGRKGPFKLYHAIAIEFGRVNAHAKVPAYYGS